MKIIIKSSSVIALYMYTEIHWQHQLSVVKFVPSRFVVGMTTNLHQTGMDDWSVGHEAS